MSAVAAAVRGFAWFAIWYFVVLNSVHLVIIALAAAGNAGARRREQFAGLEEIFHSPLAPPVSVVVPARNMAALIVGYTHGLLNLRYPQFEVIVVDDGSTDGTFERLAREFQLAEVQKVSRTRLRTAGRLHSVHAPAGGERLLVARKESVGRPADAVNTGVNLASYPLICRIDADTYLDETALLSLVRPFIEDPVQTVAAGATIRVANGSEVRAGRVIRPRVPGGWLQTIQAAEYLRCFLLGRAGWSQARGMVFMSGTFGLSRREIYELVGGVHLYTEGDDLAMMTCIHRRMLTERRPYRIACVPEPLCWTVVPARYRQLAGQRARWSQLLAEALWMHRGMMFNPRYRGIGLLVLPFYLIFELLSAVVELAALLAVIAGWAAGILSPALVLLFVAAGLGYGAFLTIVCIIIEELTFHRYRRWRDFALLVYGAVAESIGYRQLHAWWRLRGIVAAILRRKPAWLEHCSSAR